jgi:dimethylargininase
MVEQHRTYVERLKSIGLKVIELDDEPEFPDAHFVEDTAVVTPRVAVITRPGAVSRQGEENSVAPVLASYRAIERIHSPGTVDGGDVLMVGNRFYIGISDRTNRAGAEQLCTILQQYGHDPYTVKVAAGLHLKSSMNVVGENTLLLTPFFSALKILKDFDKILLDETESYAANTLLLNDHLIMPEGFPRTRRKLEKLGYPLVALDVSEVQKMDGGLTCLSIRF